MAGPSSAMMAGQAMSKCGGSQSLQSLRRQPLYLGKDYEFATFCIVSGPALHLDNTFLEK
jgi:hypothetical protein